MGLQNSGCQATDYIVTCTAGVVVTRVTNTVQEQNIFLSQESRKIHVVVHVHNSVLSGTEVTITTSTQRAQIHTTLMGLTLRVYTTKTGCAGGTIKRDTYIVAASLYRKCPSENTNTFVYLCSYTVTLCTL